MVGSIHLSVLVLRCSARDTRCGGTPDRSMPLPFCGCHDGGQDAMPTVISLGLAVCRRNFEHPVKLIDLTVNAITSDNRVSRGMAAVALA